MAIAEKNSGTTTIGYRSSPAASGTRTIRPVTCFAVVGAAVLLESIWVFGHWLADGPHRVASGPTKIPWYIAVNAHAQEAVFGLIAACLPVLVGHPALASPSADPVGRLAPPGDPIDPLADVRRRLVPVAGVLQHSVYQHQFLV